MKTIFERVHEGYEAEAERSFAVATGQELRPDTIKRLDCDDLCWIVKQAALWGYWLGQCMETERLKAELAELERKAEHEKRVRRDLFRPVVG